MAAGLEGNPEGTVMLYGSELEHSLNSNYPNVLESLKSEYNVVVVDQGSILDAVKSVEEGSLLSILFDTSQLPKKELIDGLWRAMRHKPSFFEVTIDSTGRDPEAAALGEQCRRRYKTITHIQDPASLKSVLNALELLKAPSNLLQNGDMNYPELWQNVKLGVVGLGGIGKTFIKDSLTTFPNFEVFGYNRTPSNAESIRLDLLSRETESLVSRYHIAGSIDELIESCDLIVNCLRESKLSFERIRRLPPEDRRYEMYQWDHRPLAEFHNALERHLSRKPSKWGKLLVGIGNPGEVNTPRAPFPSQRKFYLSPDTYRVNWLTRDYLTKILGRNPGKVEGAIVFGPHGGSLLPRELRDDYPARMVILFGNITIGGRAFSEFETEHPGLRDKVAGMLKEVGEVLYIEGDAPRGETSQLAVKAVRNLFSGNITYGFREAEYRGERIGIQMPFRLKVEYDSTKGFKILSSEDFPLERVGDISGVTVDQAEIDQALKLYSASKKYLLAAKRYGELLEARQKNSITSQPHHIPT
jgi:hypothetical protein